MFEDLIEENKGKEEDNIKSVTFLYIDFSHLLFQKMLSNLLDKDGNLETIQMSLPDIQDLIAQIIE